MKISFNWLKQFINIELSVEKIGDILTQTGLEVESIDKFESVRGGLADLVVGEILTCEKHPNAEKLSLTSVDIGNGDPARIVCGAPNVAVGQKVVVAPVGSTIYPWDKEEGFKLSKAKIRGEASEGMICSAYEIGLNEDHTGILVLDAKFKNGTPAVECLNVENDYVFEIGLTPNRADAASHLGVCRDLKAILGEEIKWPETDKFTSDNNDLPIDIMVADTLGAPRYSGLTMKDVTIAESPDWLKRRLLSIGLIPINNVVDITNYVNHSLGQPMHAFDYDEIVGGKVIVKTLPEGSKFTTLDEKERILAANDLMICNKKEGMCIAGVFGGLKSGIKGDTKNLFLESAYFSPDYIRKTSLRHGLKTDASFRFERGTDPNTTVKALKWTALLIKEIAGGQISSEVIDIYPNPIEDFKVPVRFRNIDRLIGKSLDHKEIFNILSALDIAISEEDKEGFVALVPPFRVDVRREADVIEEILRIHGYDNVELSAGLGTSFLADFPVMDKDQLQTKIGEFLASRGYYEIITNSLTKPIYSQKIDSINESEDVIILNKLSDDLGVMRQSVIPSGLEVISYNVSHKQKDLKLFEFGKTYRLANGKYREEEILGIYLTGNQHPESWIGDTRKVSHHDLSSTVLTILERLNISGYESKKISNDIWSSALEITFNKQLIACFGKLKKSLSLMVDLHQEVYFAELYWSRIIKKTNQVITYSEVPKFPEVRRDLSLVVRESITFADIRKLVFETEKSLIKSVNVFNVYQGEKLGSGKKAYAISFILQDEKQTLKDKQIEKVMERLMEVFEKNLEALIRK
ncbi:MAG: phenylalanine--tRNA ligase subunit beta [Bacteroidetes bacterium]|nr:phenylalanine--tRNA ligase subunit beta [Bacteroidota bacterium]MDA1121690.1 phenylalanine--tRNA ligase subunit beta [Bacteroidota bacterium]